MSKAIALDVFDRKLLEHLQFDAQTPIPILAEKIGLSAPACYRRIRRLRETGAINREVAVVHPRTLGWPLSMLVLVTMERESARTVDEMMRMLKGVPEVMEAWNVTGDHDFVVRMLARDMESYDELVRELFAADDRVRSFKTLVVIRQVKDASPVPVV
ncbi:Lrp/AsnC family transcriptional regulator [Arthrobacter sp. TPD3018]|uniref:Lrp/AsnC family transcriptional regulator n=1 Tax=Bacteria TaxID=2 RepID=UPI000D51E9FE|nr:MULTISPECIES: Lrp/AsnC family transcriptional regulator [Bacteria]PVE52654.1 Lrp/AsnC family transcriptional regulator [Sphingomonas sp. TPD3009]PVE52837.1 Lrp/AsnC family transcriptional regulator [Arthrobacter sp. TPD3018]PVE81226.1 Lrp/AsnC family transcriptional regulator [Sphingomonas melonis]